MDLKLVISLTLCHYVSARPHLGEDKNEVENIISNLQLLIPLLIQEAKTGHESESSEQESYENTQSQYLPMPIQSFLQPNDKSQHSQSNDAAIQKALLLDGPYSDIPLEAFHIDRSEITKKDLSRDPQVAIVPEDLVRQCTGYIEGKFHPSSDNEELLLAVCTELLDAGAINDYAVGTTTHQKQNVLPIGSGLTSLRDMDDAEFLQKVREFTQGLEKHGFHEHKDSKFTILNDFKKHDDNKFQEFSNLGKFKERDDNLQHEFKNLEEFETHGDNNFHVKSLDDLKKYDDNIFHEFYNLEELKKHDGNKLHKFKSIGGSKNVDYNDLEILKNMNKKLGDNNFHGYKSVDKLKRHDDEKFPDNLDKFKGRDAKIPEFKIKDDAVHEFRIDVGKDHVNDVELVVDGESLVKCDCCPNGIHIEKATTATAKRYDDDEKDSFQRVMEKILGTLTSDSRK